MHGTEVVLVPEVFNMRGVQRGLQALERLIVEAGDAGAIGLDPGSAVFAAKLLQALFGTRRDAVKRARVEGQVVELFAMQGYPLEAGRQGTVADHIDGRAAEVLSAHHQRGVGDTGLDVRQPELAPLANGIAVTVGQGAVVLAGDVIHIPVKGDCVVGRDLGAEANGALGEPRAVIKNGALHPVDTARCGFFDAVIVVGEAAVIALEFVGVPVAGRAAQALPFDKAVGFALAAGTGFQLRGHKCLTYLFGIRHRRKAADG